MIDKIKTFISEKKDEEEIKLNNVFKEKEPTKRKLRKKVNALESENEVLKEVIKSELYKTFMEKLNEPLEANRLRNENKNLRKKIKSLKELLLEEHNGKRKKKN